MVWNRKVGAKGANKTDKKWAEKVGTPAKKNPVLESREHFGKEGMSSRGSSSGIDEGKDWNEVIELGGQDFLGDFR